MALVRHLWQRARAWVQIRKWHLFYNFSSSFSWLRYLGSVEDDIHKALSHRLKSIQDVFGTIPDALEDV
ncbi:MAG: hypothetical protein WBX25_35085 [Rhodomicrobium sp.]